jgi:hypothetical protein
MKFFAKIIFTNFFILIIGLICIDAFFGNWISYSKDIFFGKDPAARFTDRYYETVFIMCPDKYLHHAYCPEISHKKKMLPVDGGETIVSYINKSSLRVAGPEDMGTATDVSSYDVINIGDSFLQADEISYKNTLSRALETTAGKKFLQVGMGSWAPINFYAWLKHNSLPQKIEVNIFVMTNDVLPNYDLSNINYYPLGNVDESGDLRFENFSLAWNLFGESDFPGKLKHALVMNSAIYRFMLRMKTKLNKIKPQEKISSPRILFDVLKEPIIDCSQKKKYDDVAILTRDYVHLAFDKDCWDENLRNSVDSAIADLRKSIEVVNKTGGKVRIFIVPAAWAFEDEGVVAKTHAKYKMGKNVAITAEPLVDYVTESLKDLNVEVISLEKVIKNLKKRTEEKLYLPFDGHWNKKAHKMLGMWMAETFYQ